MCAMCYHNLNLLASAAILSFESSTFNSNLKWSIMLISNVLIISRLKKQMCVNVPYSESTRQPSHFELLESHIRPSSIIIHFNWSILLISNVLLISRLKKQMCANVLPYSESTRQPGHFELLERHIGPSSIVIHF